MKEMFEDDKTRIFRNKRIIQRRQKINMTDMTTKNLDKEIQKINMRLASYIDNEFYLPLKEELTGVIHSLGFKKELLKGKIEHELEELKKT